MKALITGITGFAGSHLAEYLLSRGCEVYGTLRWRSKTENIDGVKESLHLVNADIRDGYSLQKVLREVRPDYCFHLAAQSFVPESWNSPIETLGTNILGTANLLEAVRSECPLCRVLVAGSSEEYGFVDPSELPIRESNPLRPMSPYGVSKVAADKLGVLYNISYGLSTVVTRAFNHTGPRRGDVFATSNFAKQIAEIEKLGKSPVIKVGNLEAKRDFTDVRDIVRAYWLAITMGAPGGVYNICSGRAVRVSNVLHTLLSMSHLDVEVREDPSRLRPSDVPVLQGDCTRFENLTGWGPVIPLDTTLKDLLDYWRSKIK